MANVVLLPGPPGVKVYWALLNQTGTNAPVATEILNTTGRTPMFGHEDTGRFVGQFLGGDPDRWDYA